MIDEIERACALLGDHPLMGHAVAPTGLRWHVTRRYRHRVVYRVSEDRGEVPAVMHPSRAGSG